MTITVENQIIMELMDSIALEMTQIVKRTAHHPIFNEINDFSCGVVDSEGRLLVQSIGNSPHLGTMYTSINGAINYLRENSIGLSEDDIIVVNDPFLGGNHLPDLLVFMPAFYNGELIMFAATRGHHGDIGGSRPGSFAGDSTEIFQEGIRIRPIKLYEKGALQRYVLDLLLANVRTPDYMRGDLMAQVGSVRVAEKRIGSLLARYGTRRVLEARDWYFDYGEKVMREEISTWPKGTYVGEDYLDDDGTNDIPVKVRARVTIKERAVEVDFEGSSPQVTGPINATLGVTLSATYNAFISLLEPTQPINFGTLRPISAKAPEGTVVNARPPAPVVVGNTETNHRITDSIWIALAKVMPEKIVAADMGTTFNVSAGGVDPRTNRYYVWYLAPPGGFGGRPTKDGISTVAGAKLGGTAAHISMEVFETKFPWYVLEENFATDSCGPGKYRGGLGIVWKIRPVNHRPRMATAIDRVKISPYGLYGGFPGLHGFIAVERNGKMTELPSKGTFVLGERDVLVMRTQGGGGYGSSLEREVDLVLSDVTNEYVSKTSAQRDYGIVVASTSYDSEKTARLRRRLKAKRGHIFLDQATAPYARKKFRVLKLAQPKRQA